jgi:hypothetical protein
MSKKKKTSGCFARKISSEKLKVTAALSVLRQFALVFKAWHCNFT